MAEIVKTINLTNDPTSIVLSDLLAAVQNSSAASALQNVDITFTCKVCKAKKTSLKELIEHVSSNTCTNVADPPAPTPRKRGRPPKVKVKAKEGDEHPPSCATKSSPPSVVNEGGGSVATDTEVGVNGRCTRIKSGALKRKSALHLLGILSKDGAEEDEDSDAAESSPITKHQVYFGSGEPPVKRGRGRPRKYVNEPILVVGDDKSDEGQDERKTEEGSNVKIKTEPMSASESVTIDVSDVEDKTAEEVYDKDKTLVIKLTKAEEEDVKSDGEVHSDAGEDNILEEAMEEVAKDLNEGNGDDSDEDYQEVRKGTKKSKMVTILCPSGRKKKHRIISKQYPCHLCHMRKFPNQAELDVHLKAHNNDDRNAADRFKCMDCEFAQNSWNRVLAHLLTHEAYRKVFENSSTILNIYGDFTCPKCSKSFNRKTALITHMRNVHQKPNHTCEICGKNFPQMDDKVFERHLDKCRNVTMKCPQCDYTTTVNYNLKLHMRVHKGKGYVCQVCSAAFPTRQRYDVHCLTHSKDRPKYICEVCSQEFVSHDAVKKHAARFHAGITERTWQCDQCSYVGKLEYDLKKHIQQVHQKRYRCEFCPFSTNVELQMTEHKEYHAPDRVFQCPYTDCYYSATSQKGLANHVSTKHNLQFKNQCPICLKRFKKKTVLLRHLITHTEDKPYVCQECDMSFYSHSSYYRHRNKTGHDSKREGVVSIPQNITIQYLEDIPPDETLPPGVESGAIISDVESVLKLATHEANRANMLLSGNMVQVHASGPSLTHENSPPNVSSHQPQSILLEGSTPGAVLKAETIGDSIVVQHASRQTEDTEQTVITEDTTATDNMVELPMVVSEDGVSYVTHLNGTEITIPEGDLNQQYIIETGDSVVDEDLEQITYVLQVDGDSTDMSSATGGLTLNEGYQILQNLKAADQHMVCQDSQDGDVQTVLEVNDDPDGQQYSVVMVQGSGDEPEAALSMLQLQCGNTTTFINTEPSENIGL